MEDGGILSIKTQSKPETTIVEITDTGHGIEEHMIEKIFEPFISTKETGSGFKSVECFSIRQAIDA